MRALPFGEMLVSGRLIIVLLLLLLAIVLVVAAGAVVRTLFPVLWGMNAGEIRGQIDSLEPLELSGRVLFVSDFHLRVGDEDLRIAIPMEDVDSVVIVGDFFESPDDFHYFGLGETDEERVAHGLRVFLPEDFEGPVYWISAVNHDPQLDPFAFSMGGIEVAHLGKIGRFTAGGREIVSIHGDDFFEGAPGGGVSWLAQRLGYPLPLERLARRRLQLPEETWLVMAHSHVPVLRGESRTANTGSFAGVPFNAILRVHVGTGILFHEDGVDLLEYEGIEPTLY